MEAVRGAVEGWEARDAVLLRVGIFLREDSAMVEVKEREVFVSFWENEKILSVDGEKRVFWWEKWLIFIEKSLQRPYTHDLMQI